MKSTSTADNDETLLTPVKLLELLSQEIDHYLDLNKPQILLDSAETPAANVAEPAAQKSSQESKSSSTRFFGSIKTFIKEKAALAIEHTFSTHATTIKFVREQMQEILRQEGSALKKMTDITILFYGLCSYISTRNSVNLHNALLKIEHLLWAHVPFERKYDLVATQVARFICENQKRANVLKTYSPDAIDAFLKDEADIVIAFTQFLGVELEKSKAQNHSQGVQPDRLEFLLKFSGQIVRAHHLISLNTNQIDKTQTAKSKPTNTIDNEKDALSSAVWQYRCLETDRMACWKWEPLKKSFWSDGTFEQLDNSTREKIATATNIAPENLSSRLILPGIINAAKLPPCMGDTYGKFLAKLPEQDYCLATQSQVNISGATL